MKPKKSKTDSAFKLICENRKARFEYQISEKIEAGLVLTGSEVKSLRQGKADLTNAYADVRKGEAFLVQAHIAPYDKGGYANHEPDRRRKLLLKKIEIEKFFSKTQTKGLSLIPLKMYFKKGLAKLELGLGKGKKLHDKRATIKDRQVKRDIERTLRK